MALLQKTSIYLPIWRNEFEEFFWPYLQLYLTLEVPFISNSPSKILLESHNLTNLQIRAWSCIYWIYSPILLDLTSYFAYCIAFGGRHPGFLAYHNAPIRGFAAKSVTTLHLITLWKRRSRWRNWRGIWIDPNSLWSPKTISLKEKT